jgi:hypothetical protein
LSTSCGAPAATAPTLVPAGQRSVEKDLQSTWEAIVGSSADRVAADQVTYVTHQKPIVGCMADHGYSYTPPPYISLIQRGTPTPIDRDYPALISLGIPQASGLDIAFQLSRAELAGSGVNPGFENLGDADRVSYANQVTACEPSEDQYANVYSDTVDAELLTSFRGVLEAANSVAESELRSYSSCMNSSGIAVDRPQDLPEAIRLTFTAGSTDPGGLAFEQAATRADSECLQKAHVVALQAVEGPLAEFTASQQTQLDAARDRWAALQAEAQGMSTTLVSLDPNAL